ncbi:sortase domain-bontaining protein [Kitasatospora sp. NPDC006697]|uniref:sortase domain-containing protein n=1 Tax=Kitasatospora sp. NPDC006697 TaxID=3364020 RepID=UPI0036AEFF07
MSPTTAPEPVAAPVVPAPWQPAATPPSDGHRLGTAQLFAAGLTILATLLLGLLLDLGPVGAVQHLRDNATGYAELRETLAKGTTPIGQRDNDGKPVALGTPVALLEIPQLGLREVIREGTSGGVLASGPGHRRDSPMPGQAGTSVLMGRQAGFGGPFGAIGQLRASETFTVTTGQGRHSFRVLDVRRAGDPVPDAPAAGAGRLLLITGDGQAFEPTGTLLVDADLVTDVQDSDPRPLGYAALPAAERSMGTDAGAWVPLVLWGEALLLAVVGHALLRSRWGRAQSWAVGVPVLAALGLAVADQVARLLPNLI